MTTTKKNDETRDGILFEYVSRLDERLEKRDSFLTNNYNERALNLVDNLSTAATAFLAIIFAFLSNIIESGVLRGKEWLFEAVLVCFSLSLVAWLLDHLTTINFLNKRKKSNKAARLELSKADTKKKYNKVAKKLKEATEKSHSTDSFRWLQVILFLAGMILTVFLTIACTTNYSSEQNVDCLYIQTQGETPNMIIRNKEATIR